MAVTNGLKLGSAVLPGTHRKLSSFTELVLPNSAGLKGLYLINGNSPASLKNYADPAKPLTVVGSPSFGTFGATLDSSNYFNTGLVEDVNRTWLVIVAPKPITATVDRACLVSNRRFEPGSGFFRGDAMQWEETRVLQNRYDRTQVTSGQAPGMFITGAVMTAWNGFAGVVQADGVARTGWRKNGTTTWTADSVAGARTVYPDFPILIGGTYTGDASSSTVALVAMHDAALTKAEIEANFTYLSGWLVALSGIAPF
ncbi:hypothetical protein [Pseudomonas sp. FP1740]|uniref:hypothetical protein n=1 Tax=Pseudomonas sp. FP1740 TaxID=2954078 RepID=UPI00273660FF|nr:hypothetical protein [Pseudomonas sp. FP1740]WLG43233.1 hypothetical protein PSH69_20540 [Pseudomonas sp. FP1740]